MANKKAKQAMVERTFSDIDRERLALAKATITECQTKAEGLAERIAGQLYIVAKKELYRIDDYSSMGEWAVDKFEISKGTCSDAINTYERFGNKDKIGTIADKYADYMFSTLIAMKGLSDAQIEKAGIQPTMSRSSVKQAITALKAIEDKEKERPELMKRLDSLCKAVHAVCKDKDRVRALIESVVPDWFVKEKVNSVDEIQACIDCLTEELEKLTADPEPEEESSTVENAEPESAEEESSAVENTEPLDVEHSQSVREMAAESSSTVEKESPESIPQIQLNIEEYRKDNNAIDKKAFLEAVWRAAQTVFNHNGEIVLTWND